MIQGLSSGDASPGLGPEPRWFVYVAAVICGGFFSNLVLEGLSFGLGGLVGEGVAWIVIESLGFGVVSGAIWGLILAWAVRLKLSYIAIILGLGTLVVLAPVFTQLVLMGSGDPEVTGVLWVPILTTLGHVAVFWITLLAIAIPPRRRLRQSLGQDQ